MVIDVKHQGREVKSAITGQRRRIDVDDAGNRGPITEQIQKMKIEMCEINSGRDRGAATRADPAHGGQQLPGIRSGRHRGMQAIAVAAGQKGGGDQIPPVRPAVAQARLGVVEPEQRGQQPGQRRVVGVPARQAEITTGQPLLDPERPGGAAQLAGGPQAGRRVAASAEPPVMAPSACRPLTGSGVIFSSQAAPPRSRNQNAAPDSPPAGTSDTTSRPACARTARTKFARALFA